MMLTCLIFVLMLSSALASNNLDQFHCYPSNESCEVPYLPRSSVLVLHCPGSIEHKVKWVHTVYDLTNSRYQNVSVNCSNFNNRTCNLEGYEGRRTNDDSGLYYCIESETTAMKINVTILAPPKIINVFNHAGICSPQMWRYTCETSKVPYRNYRFNLTIKYASVAPVTVRWYVNETELQCPSLSGHNHCYGVTTTQKYSTIELVPDDKLSSLNGKYRAEVSNIYGFNSTITDVHQDCNKPAKDVTNDDVYFDVTAGEPLPVELTRACRDGSETYNPRFLYFTSNPNITFEEIEKNLTAFHEGAKCDDIDFDVNRACSDPFSNNNHFIVRASTETCPSIVNLSIQSRKGTTVDFSDNGRIFCVSKTKLYTTIHIRVVTKPPPNFLILEIAVPVGTVVLLMIVTLLVIISALGYKYRAVLRTPSRSVRRRRRAEAEREALLVQEQGHVRVSPTVSSKQRPPRRGYQTFPTTSSDFDPGVVTDVQSDLPGDLPVQLRRNPEEIEV